MSIAATAQHPSVVDRRGTFACCGMRSRGRMRSRGALLSHPSGIALALAL